MIANYSLNQLFKFPTRYGDWSIEAFVYYTDGIDNKLESTTQVWGGTGVIFKY
jgi:PhoPQ-activated pathogenicity-related protein